MTEIPSSTMRESTSSVAMTPQQRALGGGKLATYRRYVAGDASLPCFVSLELYNLFLSGMPSILGLGLRSFALKALLGRVAGAPAVGRGVTIRQPQFISFGKGVTIDDYAALHCNSSDNSEASIELGNNSLVGRGTILAAKGGRIVLGDACNIGSDCRIATQSSVTIGKSVLVAAYVYIGPGNHVAENPDMPIMEQGMDIKDGVKIGDNCWIGTRATIVDGVSIGANSIVGAHSLVLQDVPENSVVAGTPAKVIKAR